MAKNWNFGKSPKRLSKKSCGHLDMLNQVPTEVGSIICPMGSDFRSSGWRSTPWCAIPKVYDSHSQPAYKPATSCSQLNLETTTGKETPVTLHTNITFRPNGRLLLKQYCSDNSIRSLSYTNVSTLNQVIEVAYGVYEFDITFHAWNIHVSNW